jgi:hypothetical protein
LTEDGRQCVAPLQFACLLAVCRRVLGCASTRRYVSVRLIFLLYLHLT